MTVQCVECSRFALRGSQLAPHGLGHCAHRPKWEHYPAERPIECPRFEAAKVEQVEARRRWLAKKGST